MLATLGPVGTAISGLDNLIGLMGGGGFRGCSADNTAIFPIMIFLLN